MAEQTKANAENNDDDESVKKKGRERRGKSAFEREREIDQERQNKETEIHREGERMK